jgi:uncharacterized protein YpuA (DUF1002 family)
MAFRKLDLDEKESLKELVREVNRLAHQAIEKDAYTYDWQRVQENLCDAKNRLRHIIQTKTTP